MSDHLDNLIRQACFDPGQFTRRGDNYQEDLWAWQARAVQAAIEPYLDHLKGRLVDANYARICAQNPGIEESLTRDQVAERIQL